MFLSNLFSRSHSPKIHLVCTTHTELGKCNSDELSQIIESIKPEIIFEEMSEDLFNRYYIKNEPIRESLEVKCIKKYLQSHNIAHLPVDIEPSHDLSVEDIENMFAAFRKYDVYRSLEDKQNSLTASGGFDFLNSNECLELFRKRIVEEGNLMMFNTSRKDISRIHKLFHQEHDVRENKMLQNIYDYSKANQYNRGVFFVGAAHRNSIMKKIADFEKKEKVKLSWKFGF